MAISKRLVSVLALALLAFAGGETRLDAQFGVFYNMGHTPQARTQEEFDLYLEILTAKTPGEQLARAERFKQRYPESELMGSVWLYEMLAHRELENFEGVLEAGRRALRLLPDNLKALLTLASVIPNGVIGRSDAEALLDEAEAHARRALEIIPQKRIPRQIELAEWRRLQKQLQAQAHETLGHIAAKRGRLQEAVREFERATALNPSPDGKQFYRLGVAYAWTGRNKEAAQALRRAAELGPPLIERLARAELGRLEAGKSSPEKAAEAPGREGAGEP